MTQIQSMGYTKTYINNNNDIQEKEIKWIGNENGNDLNIQLAVNDNGHKEQMDIQLDKDDVMDILKTQTIGIPLTTRLQNDFLPIKKRKHHSMRRKHTQKRKQKTRTRSKRRNKR